MKAEIISIGRELLMGETVDTNASFLAKQLPSLGIDLVWVSQVGDVQSQIVEVLNRAWARSELIMTTGGLGPTGDDLTRESIAEMMHEKMTLVPELEESLRERFRHLGMHQMPETNLKQCMLIPSASAIPNPQGTAPGWWIDRAGRILVCMPGPPREMHDMWDRTVRARLVGRSGQIILAKTWKTSGFSEAAVGEMSFPLFPTENPSLGVYAKQDGIHLQLKVAGATLEEARDLLSAGEAKIRRAFSTSIWGVDEDTLESVVGALLLEKRKKLAVMEDYTAGYLTGSLANATNSDSFFSGGIIARSSQAKIALGVPKDALNLREVSSEVGAAMAEAARVRLGADIGIGITGMEAAETGESVYYAIADGTLHSQVVRPRTRERLATSILFELRKLLLEKTG